MTSAAAAHRGVVTVFLVNGLLLATWMTGIHAVKVATGLSAGGLGTVLMVPVVSSLLAMQAARRLLARLGSKAVIGWCLAVTGLALWATSFARNGVQLGVALACLGLADGILFVAMNAQGVAVERRSRRSRMNAYHAAWSGGSLLAGLLAAGFAWAGAGLRTQFLVIALVSIVASAVATPGLLAEDPDPADTAPTAGREPGARRSPAGVSPEALVLGLLGLGCLVAQGAVQDWGTVFLREQRSATPFLASAGFVAFSGMLVLGRLLGDRLRAAFSDSSLFRAFAFLAFAGMAFSVVVPSAPAGVLGFGLFGAGLSILDPILSSAVGNGRRRPVAAVIAQVATLSQTGLLLGPPAIGWLADWIGLPGALLLPALLILTAGLVAPRTAVLAEPRIPAPRTDLPRRHEAHAAAG
jgi:MFS family permease